MYFTCYYMCKKTSIDMFLDNWPDSMHLAIGNIYDYLKWNKVVSNILKVSISILKNL